MSHLHFSFQEFDTEIDAISGIAKGFITPSSIDVLKSLRDNLEQIRREPAGRRHPWGIGEHWPLTTITSRGEYEPNSRGQHPVFALISSIWEIEPLGNHGNKFRSTRKFALVGNASTSVGFAQPGPILLKRMQFYTPAGGLKGS